MTKQDPDLVQAQADMDEEEMQRQQAAEDEWEEICNAQNWDEVTQVIHLEGFIREKELFPEFTAYARRCAGEENEEIAYVKKLDAILATAP